MSTLIVQALQCEYRTNPLGIGTARPRFSWQLESDRRGTMQSGYRLVLTEDGYESPLWDTDFVASEQSIQVEYEGPELRSRARYSWRVKVWDSFGRESDWSEAAWLETGLLSPDEWQARWITPSPEEMDPESDGAFLFRRRFEAAQAVASARIYATAAGAYELYVNGSRVSEEVLAPGWTSYHNRHQYQTYDVTGLVRSGVNAIGILLGNGWYRSGIGFEGRNYKYGEHKAALLQLHIRYADGSEEVVITDTAWQAAASPIVYSTIYHGETYDARLEREDWSQPVTETENGTEGWSAVQELDLPLRHLVAQENWPTRVTETIKPVAYIRTPAGDHVLDMGQNMVGRMRFQVEAPAGTRIVLRHAEVLDKEGNIYFDNLRPAKQTVEYIAKGGGTEEYAPHFTFMGFRYVSVEGYPGAENGLPLEAFTGEVLHSDMPEAGGFECSDPAVNQLQSNIRWGQRGNFLDVPTDCPQRDERLGWTGDAQVFISTALFNFQGAPFFAKWLHDLKAEQLPDGGVPFVIPDVVGGANSAAWGDAAVICPWTVYHYYGDKRLLAEQYDSMRKWVEYIRAQGENEAMWDTGFHFGDWLALDAKENSYIGATPTALIATAYYAYSTRLVREAAEVLGYKEDAQTYGELYERIVVAFRDEFITKNGRMASPTQTAHVLALMFGLVEGSVKERIARDLNDLIVDHDYHLSTGFVGTPYLCFALSNSGYHATAVKLLLQMSYPGWLYSVSKGATTIWEHWDSIKPDGSFWSDDMNSFNHYSYGAIGDWMYRRVAGLDSVPGVPAFKRIRIAPMFGQHRLTHAAAFHRSMYGLIESGWRVEGDSIEVYATIPANTTAEVFLKGAKLESLAESGKALDGGVEGISSVSEEDGGVKLCAGSGTYKFTYAAPSLFRVGYSERTKLREVLDDEQAMAILQKHAPHLTSGAPLGILQSSSFQELRDNGMANLSKEAYESIMEELVRL